MLASADYLHALANANTDPLPRQLVHKTRTLLRHVGQGPDMWERIHRISDTGRRWTHEEIISVMTLSELPQLLRLLRVEADWLDERTPWWAYVERWGCAPPDGYTRELLPTQAERDLAEVSESARALVASVLRTNADVVDAFKRRSKGTVKGDLDLLSSLLLQQP